MNKKQFRAFLDLLLCADPWPLPGKVGEEGQRVIKVWADEQARMFGYKDWIEAFHQEGWEQQKVEEGEAMNKKETREKLAAYAHDAWSRWMKYLFGKSVHHEDVVVIPAESVERWKRQMNTEYSNLPESEKKSDRDEADKMLEIIRDGDKEERFKQGYRSALEFSIKAADRKRMEDEIEAKAERQMLSRNKERDSYGAILAEERALAAAQIIDELEQELKR